MNEKKSRGERLQEVLLKYRELVNVSYDLAAEMSAVLDGEPEMAALQKWLLEQAVESEGDSAQESAFFRVMDYIETELGYEVIQ